MNTYNDNLLTAVKGILGTLSTEEAKHESAQTIARQNLYFAVGTELRFQDNLKKVNEDYLKTLAINDQGVANSNLANELMNSAQTADQHVSTLITNTATVAQNVQTAANAILKLAADIGSANNIVYASDYTQLYTTYTEPHTHIYTHR